MFIAPVRRPALKNPSLSPIQPALKHPRIELDNEARHAGGRRPKTAAQ
jgi:hypothetical protein